MAESSSIQGQGVTRAERFAQRKQERTQLRAALPPHLQLRHNLPPNLVNKGRLGIPVRDLHQLLKADDPAVQAVRELRSAMREGTDTSSVDTSESARQRERMVESTQLVTQIYKDIASTDARERERAGLLLGVLAQQDISIFQDVYQQLYQQGSVDTRKGLLYALPAVIQVDNQLAAELLDTASADQNVSVVQETIDYLGLLAKSGNVKGLEYAERIFADKRASWVSIHVLRIIDDLAALDEQRAVTILRDTLQNPQMINRLALEHLDILARSHPEEAIAYIRQVETSTRTKDTDKSSQELEAVLKSLPKAMRSLLDAGYAADIRTLLDRGLREGKGSYLSTIGDGLPDIAKADARIYVEVAQQLLSGDNYSAKQSVFKSLDVAIQEGQIPQMTQFLVSVANSYDGRTIIARNAEVIAQRDPASFLSLYAAYSEQGSLDLVKTLPNVVMHVPSFISIREALVRDIDKYSYAFVEILPSLLPEIAARDPQTYEAVLKVCLSTWNLDEEAIHSLEAVANIDPARYVGLFTSLVQEPNYRTREHVQETFGALARTDPRRAWEIIQWAENQGDYQIRNTIGALVGSLVEVGDPQAISLTINTLNDESPYSQAYRLRPSLLEYALPKLLRLDEYTDTAINIAQRYLFNTEGRASERGDAAKSLPIIAELRPDIGIHLAEQLLFSDWQEVQIHAAESLAVLLQHSSGPDVVGRIQQLVLAGIRSPETRVREASMSSLTLLLDGYPQMIIEHLPRALGDASTDIEKAGILLLRQVLEKGFPFPEGVPFPGEQLLALMDDARSQIKEDVTAMLPVLARQYPELVLQLVHVRLNAQHDFRAGEEIMKQLPGLFEANPVIAMDLMQLGLGSDNSSMRQEASSHIDIAFTHAPDQMKPLIAQILAQEKEYSATRKNILSLMPVFVSTDKVFAQQIMTNALQNDFGKRTILETVPTIAQVDLDFAIQIVEMGLEDSSVAISAVKHLEDIAKADPLKAQGVLLLAMESSHNNVRFTAYKLLPYLRQVNPSLYQQMLARVMREENFTYNREVMDVALEAARSIDFSDFSLLYGELRRKIEAGEIHIDEASFVLFRIQDYLITGEDVGNVIPVDLQWFRRIKMEAEQTNQTIPEEKRVADTNAFWQRNQKGAAALFSIDPRRGEALINERLHQFGFERVERIFSAAEQLSLPARTVLHTLMTTVNNVDATFLERLVEFAQAYEQLGAGEQLVAHVQEVGQHANRRDVTNMLGQKLLQEFANKLHIDATVTPEAFSQWDLEHLSKLFVAEQMFRPESRQFLRIVIKLTLQGDFDAIRRRVPGYELQGSYTAEERKLIEEIQSHNSRVEQAFTERGLDYAIWLAYKPQANFEVGAPSQQRDTLLKTSRTELENAVADVFRVQQLEPSIRGSFEQVFREFELTENGGRYTFSSLSLETLQQISSRLADTLRTQISPTEPEGSNLRTALAHFEELQAKLSEARTEMDKSKISLTIKQWDGNPGHDLFQGNATHCCIAIDHANNGAIVDYLLDTGVTILEVKDQATGKVAAQTFVYMARTSDGRNMMVLDNIEVNSNYIGVSTEIRDQLFAYSRDFARAVSTQQPVSYVALGVVYNDVVVPEEYDGQQVRRKSMHFSKIGTNDTFLSVGQYFDSLRGWSKTPYQMNEREMHLIWRNPEGRGTPMERLPQDRLRVDVVGRDQLPELIPDILHIEEAIFAPLDMEDEGLIESITATPNVVNIAVRDESGRVVGFASGAPHDEVADELIGFDSAIGSDPHAFYISTIALLPEARGLTVFNQIAEAISRQARRQGYTKLTTHARVNDGLSSVLQRRYGARQVRRMEDWLGAEGETADYLEIDLPGDRSILRSARNVVRQVSPVGHLQRLMQRVTQRER